MLTSKNKQILYIVSIIFICICAYILISFLFKFFPFSPSEFYLWSILPDQIDTICKNQPCGSIMKGIPVCLNTKKEKVDDSYCSLLPIPSKSDILVQCPKCSGKWTEHVTDCLDKDKNVVTCGNGNIITTYTCDGGQCDPKIRPSDKTDNCIVKTGCMWNVGNWENIGDTISDIKFSLKDSTNDRYLGIELDGSLAAGGSTKFIFIISNNQLRCLSDNPNTCLNVTYGRKNMNNFGCQGSAYKITLNRTGLLEVILTDGTKYNIGVSPDQSTVTTDDTITLWNITIEE
jgi:hypothetical protein